MQLNPPSPLLLGLRDHLLAEVNDQLEAKNIIMTEGRINIIDATSKRDSDSDADADAGWPVKNNSRDSIRWRVQGSCA